MRFLGVDVGRRRIGLALSDASGLIASAWQTVEAGPSLAAAAARVGAAIDTLRDPIDDGPAVGGIVVGLPRRLDGTEHEQTALARAFAALLHAATGVQVHFQDERLTSREAEARLAAREPDWRRRKARVDAEAAAIILQDFLDARCDVRRAESTEA
ncbi:MAG: Holliday junction resolvase RuvX [Acidobacteria bacterium]|nr:Holliday junction resolvase RuvX [Acidobacteriota bacterium]